MGANISPPGRGIMGMYVNPRLATTMPLIYNAVDL